MRTLAPFEFEVFMAGMACLAAVTLWLAIYLPAIRETRRLSLRSLIALMLLVAVAFAIVRAVRW